MNPTDGAAKDFANNKHHPMMGNYTVQIGDEKFLFKNIKLTVPPGVFGQNYGRLAYTFMSYISVLIFLGPFISNTIW